MKVAIEGCAHGELEKIYDTIALIEQQQNIKVDLLLCCGDFQATRNLNDLECMAVPKKFRDICTFYKWVFYGQLGVHDLRFGLSDWEQQIRVNKVVPKEEANGSETESEDKHIDASKRKREFDWKGIENQFEATNERYIDVWNRPTTDFMLNNSSIELQIEWKKQTTEWRLQIDIYFCHWLRTK